MNFCEKRELYVCIRHLMARLPQTAAVYLQSNQEQWRRLMHESNNCFSGKLKKESMKRSVTYSVVARKNPNPMAEGEVKYYARAQARGVMGIREMAERIQQACTVTRADVMAVLVSLEDVVAEGLASGEIVRLGDLGSLQISLSGEGAVSKEEYDDSLINRVRMLFRSGQTLREAINNLTYEQVPVKSATDEAGGEADSDEEETV